MLRAQGLARMRRQTQLYNLLLLVCMATGLACSHGRLVASGDLFIPFTADNAAVNIDPESPEAMPSGCHESASADFASRIQLPQYSSTVQSSWGPDLNVYPPLQPSQVPPQCNPTAWAWQRLLAAINYTISLDINYCHHHAPAYVTPAKYRVGCDPVEAGVDQPGCVCNTAGLTARANGWQGVDCSNYVAWLYNFAFGYYPTSAVGAQACAPSAPGRLLSSVTVSRLDRLNPGDLLYITLSSTGRIPPVKVSHVVLWTGWQVDFSPNSTGPLAYSTLVGNLDPNQRPGIVACMTDRVAKGLPVYVISDSHYTGPNLRPFCGWYANSFSHARRIINPEAGLLKNSDSIAYYNSKGDCMSMWALRG